MKNDVIPDRLEKYMAFKKKKNVVLIDSMQFMNSSLKKLVKTCQKMISNIWLNNLILKI